MNFIILADKYQKGMKSKGCVGLIRVNQRNNVFQHQYKIIKSYFPLAKIIYIYGFDNKRYINFINDYGYSDVISIFNSKYEELNYAYSLSLASQYLNKSCFVLFGDTIFKKQIFEDFNSNQGSQIYLNKKEKNKLGCVLDKDNIVHNISFDLDNYLMDIYFIHKQESNMLKTILNNPKYNNCFLFEIINKMIDNGTKFKGISKNKKDISSKLCNKIKV